MSDAALILGDPGARTNYRTVAMGIAYRTSMIVPAPNVPDFVQGEVAVRPSARACAGRRAIGYMTSGSPPAGRSA